MTIYTSKTGEKKEDDNVDPPVVVTEAWVEPADKAAKEKELEAAGGTLPSVVAVSRRRGKHSAANICIVLCAIIVLGLGILGGVYLYKHLAHRQTFQGWCGVEYYEREQREQHQRERQRGGHHKRPGGRGPSGKNHHWQRHGRFEEEVELDKGTGNYERIHVPAIEECRSATILHDFSKNYTAIVDNDSHRCFIMNLNRTLVRPPKDFWDLIRKLKSGYYMPKAEVIREYYQVMHPPVVNLEKYGYYIWHDCRWFTTYKLQRRSPKPVAMQKRSSENALQYSEGNTGTQKIVFVEISGV